MSMIMRDNKTGKVSMASISTIEKNGRILLFPQMIDITDVQDEEEIVKLIMDFEMNFEPEEETEEEKRLRKKAEKSWSDSFNAKRKSEKIGGIFGIFNRRRSR